MKYPGYKSAREMINKDNQTPSEIASEAGHTVLAEDIKVWGYDSEKKELDWFFVKQINFYFFEYFQNTKSASHYEELRKWFFL